MLPISDCKFYIMWVYIGLTLVFLWLISKKLHLYSKYAVSILTSFEELYTSLTKELKEDHLKGLANTESADPECKERGVFRLLEIGTGPGANFQYFPHNALVTTTEPNNFFEETFEKHRKKYPSVQFQKSLIAKCEDLHMVASESMDVVVSTVVLCTVDDVAKSLKEIRRVLAPGGKFYYFEHCYDHVEWSWLRIVQNIFEPVYPYVFDGCHTNRDLSKDVSQAGFSHVEESQFYIPTGGSLDLAITQSHVKGVATK